MLSLKKIVLPSLCAIVFAACASNSFTILFRIPGGEKIPIKVGSKGPEVVKNRYASIYPVGCAPAADKTRMNYDFNLIALQPGKITRITVEDVSDDRIEPMLDDTAPAFNDKQHWRGLSPQMAIDDPRIAWIYHIDATTRLFRFTLYTGTEKTVLYQAAFINPLLKKMMRLSMEPKEEPVKR